MHKDEITSPIIAAIYITAQLVNVQYVNIDTEAAKWGVQRIKMMHSSMHLSLALTPVTHVHICLRPYVADVI